MRLRGRNLIRTFRVKDRAPAARQPAAAAPTCGGVLSGA